MWELEKRRTDTVTIATCSTTVTLNLAPRLRDQMKSSPPLRTCIDPNLVPKRGISRLKPRSPFPPDSKHGGRAEYIAFTLFDNDKLNAA